MLSWAAFVPSEAYSAEQADSVFFPGGVDDEDAVLAYGGRLMIDGGTYFSGGAKASLVAGPAAGIAAVDQALSTNAVIRFQPDGIPVDEFTIILPFLSKGVDLSAQPTGTFTLLSYASQASAGSAISIAARNNEIRTNVSQAGSGVSGPTLSIVSGDVPADTWCYLTLTYDGATMVIMLNDNAKSVSKAVSRSSLPITGSARLRNGPGLSLNCGTTIATAGAFKVGLPHIMRYARTYGQAGSGDSPTVTVNVASELGEFPVDMAGVVAQYDGWTDKVDTDSANRTAQIAAAATAGVRTARLEHTMDAVVVTNSSAPFTYDWTNIDDKLDALIEAGIDRMIVCLGYCTTNLDGGASETGQNPASQRAVPSDFDQYAQHCSDYVQRVLDRGATIVGLSFWNEPDGATFWSGNVSQFLSLWDTVRAKLEEDFDGDDRVPALGTCEAGGSFPASNTYLLALIDYASDNNLPLSAIYVHEYSGSLEEMHTTAMSIRARKTAFASTPVRNTEWCYDLAYLTQYRDVPGSLAAHQGNPSHSSMFPAYAYAAIVEMIDEGYDASAINRLGELNADPFGAEQYTGLTSNDTPPAPRPVYAAFQAIGSHRGQRTACSSNWPSVRALASIDDGVVNVSVGSYTGFDLTGTTNVAVDVSPLPSSFGWSFNVFDPENPGSLIAASSGDQSDFPLSVALPNLGVGLLRIVPTKAMRSLARARVPGEGWRTVPVSSGLITRINTDTGGWRTGQLERGLIRVFKNGMWQTVQYPETGE